jgi:hypothetical protein
MACNCILVETRGAVGLVRLGGRIAPKRDSAEGSSLSAFLGKRAPRFTHE